MKPSPKPEQSPTTSKDVAQPPRASPIWWADKSLVCPHCGTALHVEWLETWLFQGDSDDLFATWEVLHTFCPACYGLIVELCRYHDVRDEHTQSGTRKELDERLRLYPHGGGRKPAPPEVPPDIARDYEEARTVLPLSPKASAALSRRCLQAVLREQGYLQNNLVDQITAALEERDRLKVLPTTLRETIDAIRSFGNFSAHPTTDVTTLQVIDVEPEEAAWCLEILEQAFDHLYVKPAQTKARRAALDEKLRAAGKGRAK